MRYFIGDTETTGLKGTKACELAFVEIDPHSLQILGSWQSLIDPEQPFEPGASKIHGITAEMVAEEPTLQEFIDVVMGGRIEDPCTLIGYNVKFDKGFFAPLMNIQKTFCALELCRRIYPTGPANHKLGTMAEFLGLDAGQSHRAMSDVMTVHQMLGKVLPLTGKSLLANLDIPVHTVYVMPFGEHQGKLLADLPKSYRTWLLSVDIDPNLRHSLMELRKAGI